MTMQPLSGPPEIPPTRHPSDHGILDQATAIALAEALGLLGSQGLGYVKSMKGATAAEKAIDKLLEALEALKKDAVKGGKGVSPSKIEEDIKNLVKALKGLGQLLNKNQDYLKGYTKNTQDIRKNLEKFLKGVLKQIAGDLGNETVTGNNEYNGGFSVFAKLMDKVMNGTATPADVKKLGKDIKYWISFGPGMGTLTNKVAEVASRASQEWSQYSARAKIITTNANRLIDLAEKSQSILAKTLQTIIQKF